MLQWELVVIKVGWLCSHVITVLVVYVCYDGSWW